MVGILAAIGIAFWAITGLPPAEEGEEGAVGAANRYRAEQISDSDVVLEDAEVIALLQDDVFLELIQDEDFQTLMAHQGVASALAAYGTVGLYHNMTPAMFLARPDVQYMAGRPDVQVLLRNPKFRGVLEKAYKTGEGAEKEGRIGRSSNVWGTGPQIELMRTKFREFLERPEVVAEFEKAYKTGEGAEKEGRIGRSSNVWEKAYKTGEGAEKEGRIEGRIGRSANTWAATMDIVNFFARPDVALAMRNPSTVAFLKHPDYVQLGKAYKTGEGAEKEGRIGRSSNVWEKAYKTGEGAEKEGRILDARFDIELDKAYKTGEGAEKEGRIGRSSNVWDREIAIILGSDARIGFLLASPEVSAYFARPDVRRMMERTDVQNLFATANIAQTLKKLDIATLDARKKATKKKTTKKK
jgi:hypothetical protein